MRLYGIGALVGACLVAGMASAYADDYSIGLKLRAWNATMDGGVQVDESSIVGTKLNVDKALDLDKDSKTFEGQITFKPSNNSRLDLNFWSNKFEGEKRITDAIVFNGQTYSVGTLVDTNLDLKVGTLTYEYLLPIPKIPAFTLQVGPLVGVKVISFDGELIAVDAPTPFSESKSMTAPIPVVGARAFVEILGWFSAEAEIDGFKISNIQDIDATIIEASVEVTTNLMAGLYVGAGYHYFSVDVKDNGGSGSALVDIDFTIDGLFLVAGIRF